MTHSQQELEHAERARGLQSIFASEERLAEFLHQNYRATALAMERLHKIALGPAKHHHGFCDCYGKKKLYFFRRAKWLMTEFPKFNGRFGAEK